MKVDVTNQDDDFETPNHKAVLNTSKAKENKANYHSYKLSMPQTKRNIKTGVESQASTNRGINTTKRSMKSMNKLSNSVAYASSYSKLYQKNSGNINAMTTIKADIDNAREKIEIVKDLREKASAESSEEKKLILLNKENIILRDELKTINNGLNKFIEVLKDFKIKKIGKPKYGNENYSTEYKLKSREEEEKICQQLIQNMSIEYNKLKKRLEKVGDPSYGYELRRQIAAKKKEIKELDDTNRQLRNEKFQREKRIDKVFKAGQPDAMNEIDRKIQEMNILFDRDEKLRKQLEFQEKTKDEANKQFDELKQKLSELETKANEKGVDYNNPNDDHEIVFEVSKDPATYERKKNIIQQSIETDKAAYIKKLNDLKHKLVKALEEQNEVTQRIRERQGQTMEKRKEVNDLMVKCHLILESDVIPQNVEEDETLKDLPEEIEIQQDDLIAKITSVIKPSKKHKRKARNNKSRIILYK